ncbi:hypothetical protein [Gimesia chilikensis]|uniref:Uncharacterized protein n=1 Tax=Gimesia chilikensis TaxID=2605989 RepID=A0A517PNU5_9PLAN|nr:hypothetical protein [Gimesia chilikensis]QDT21040.1 hypothetical protein HG66A1_28330 [Gimesia chilikensis]
MQGLRFKKSIAVLAWGIGPLLCSTPAVNAASEVDRDAGPIAAEKPVTESATDAPEQSDAKGKQPKLSPIKIDPVVREGTAHLDIDETTRSRYSYYNGHWWFYLGDGNWMISRNGKWEDVDTSRYHQSQQKMGSSGAAVQGGAKPKLQSGTTRYYDDSPAYGNYYGNGTYYDGSYTRPFYNNNGRGDYGRGYYGNGFYGRGYYGRGYYGNGYYGRGLNNGSSNGRWGTGAGGYSGGRGFGSSGGAAIGFGP